jgi:curved DNA-binding protein CbpA
MSAPAGRTLPAFDVYAELGISPGATADEVRAAYRRRAKEHHPDLAVDPSAAEARMKRINQARDVLLDPERRAEYDRGRATSRAAGAHHDAAGAQGERERRARAERERRARVQAEHERWEREAEARAAREVAARAERRRRAHAGAKEPDPGRARSAAGPVDPAGPVADLVSGLRAVLGGRVAVEIRVRPAGPGRRSGRW